mmetsp:Transcript_28801/g.27727  ORF Transcript_28801/g.27727 Transcript_28801/m.27727 type:complete len:202 (-) Transcript_28801:419-1024(-)
MNYFCQLLGRVHNFFFIELHNQLPNEGVEIGVHLILSVDKRAELRDVCIEVQQFLVILQRPLAVLQEISHIHQHRNPFLKYVKEIFSFVNVIGDICQVIKDYRVASNGDAVLQEPPFILINNGIHQSSNQVDHGLGRHYQLQGFEGLVHKGIVDIAASDGEGSVPLIIADGSLGVQHGIDDTVLHLVIAICCQQAILIFKV